ncbi:MAG: adenosylcobalamin-dependent ribonucleoside-diphosphate reductase [Candidatus Nanoarchaeia archaeon]|nr:adenosylcobalamin-dependent ribonucleoside-diphosphate reductase [Candidatus Nanoarchaeia archaeon]MDD5741705.1 adenosylcobalamin-dependent ribonucleoside-diphosphate reductase [Candidatus Nanoarchaeia archaeon]
MADTKSGLGIERYFSKMNNNLIVWEKKDTQIVDESRKPLFIQKDAEFPSYFSTVARQIVASRYFYGEPGTAERETSFKTLVERVSDTYRKWSIKQRYFNEEEAGIFKDEITDLCLRQKMSPNSPVWFNVGTERYESRKSKERKEGYIVSDKDRKIKVIDNRGKIFEVDAKKGEIIPLQNGEDHLYPQTSACFIQHVPDTMEGIIKLQANEAMLFKYGSGTGTDLSTLRSSKEKLSGGGNPSGPLAYLVHYDKLAGIVKSGGKTRRAAKMDSLRIDHPDIKDFIEAKTDQEKLINTLISGGVSQVKAVENVHYQNTNISVRITDDFMKAVENDLEWQTIPVHNKEMIKDMPKYKARELFRMIAEGTHFCGDPGIQFHTTINKWHTCQNSGPINASNPCSEYMFIDDSSCNLSSQNLRGFVDENGMFNADDFESAVRTTAILMDLNYDDSSFPTYEIAQNSHDFRPLGMGHANIGGFLMARGIPYDSDEARAIAASITALMTGKVYETSTEMAEKIGTFTYYEKNKEPMMEVIKMHRDALPNIDRGKLNGLEYILDRAYQVWGRVVERGEKYGFRNAQATVLAPTGTIGFMMDCDTKGIEPEIGLVQTKLLAEGGTLRMINGCVPLGLRKLGYNEEEIDQIVKYVAGHGTEQAPYLKQEHKEELKKCDTPSLLVKKLEELKYDNDKISEIRKYAFGYETVEGCSLLKPEHLPVFDCSNKPEWAKRTIHYSGHLKMMAAVQPFLSGAISKTVNLPKEATVEEIEKVYKEAWKLGLKAVALYRDGSKARQPLSFSKDNLEKKVAGTPVRKKLPNERPSITHKFNVAGHEGYLTVGLYEDKTPGELFITMSKEGSTVGGLMDTIGTLTSFALQYGVPIRTLVNKMRRNRFEPYGIVMEGHKDVHTAVSLIDYIFTYLGKRFNCLESSESGAYDSAKTNDNEGSSSERRKDDFVLDEILDITNSLINSEKNNFKEGKKNTGNAQMNKNPDGGYCIKCGAQMYKEGHCKEICFTPDCDFVSYNGCGS